jgi:cytidylate kinase
VSRVVAIDGPSGSGKSTVARGVAAALGLPTLDTGAMYRAVTAAALRAGVDPRDADGATAVAQRVRIDVAADVTRLDGEDVSAEIRGPEVTAAVSAVSAHPGVRAVLVARQRDWVAEHGGGVVEGRDIGTVVFPDARVKVYLTASDDERARRRQRDEVAAARAVSVDQLRDSMAARDRADSTRAASPLSTAADATMVDTTDRTPESIVTEIVALFEAAEGA